MQVSATHRAVLLASLLFSAVLTPSCASGPKPCVSPGSCGTGYECLANTCVRQGGEPVAPRTERVALEPTRWQVLSPDTTDTTSPAAVHFGGPAQDVLLLDFELPALDASRVTRAFLVVSPLPDAAQGSTDASVSAWRIVEDWSDTVNYVHQPRADRPSAEGIARSPLPLRIDVTDLVRRWLENSGTTHGIALKSSSGAGQPQVYATGLGPGKAPLLEVYFESPDRAEKHDSGGGS
ncbi:MAG: DNRLRE domain-containing protein [Myxococcales bacterium]|nr:DNRLRE domain-containing protein [Myxococcales bacterium]